MLSYTGPIITIQCFDAVGRQEGNQPAKKFGVGLLVVTI